MINTVENTRSPSLRTFLPPRSKSPFIPFIVYATRSFFWDSSHSPRISFRSNDSYDFGVSTGTDIEAGDNSGPVDLPTHLDVPCKNPYANSPTRTAGTIS